MSSALRWSSPPRVPSLDTDEIHLWWIEVETAAVQRTDWLSPDERARAGRLREAARFTGFRCALRALLGAYLATHPAALRFDYGPHGKPRLALPDAPLAFNLAHSADRGLLALRRGADVGIDLERVRPFTRAMEIARRQLGEEIARTLSALPEPDRTGAFFEHWTRMEAGIKALGGTVFSGCAAPVHCVSFTPRGGWRAALASPEPLPPAGRWRTFRFPPTRLDDGDNP